MSKERYKEIIFRVYEKALMKYAFDWLPYTPPGGYLQTQEIFIHKCKIDKEFSEEFGLKIEERELSLEERSFIARSNHYEASVNIKINLGIDEDHTLHKQLDDIGIATKQITLTYQNETIQFYE